MRKVGVVKEKEQTTSKRKDHKPVIKTSQTGPGRKRKPLTPAKPPVAPPLAVPPTVPVVPPLATPSVVPPLAVPPSPTEVLANRITDNITSDSTPNEVISIYRITYDDVIIIDTIIRLIC